MDQSGGLVTGHACLQIIGLPLCSWQGVLQNPESPNRRTVSRRYLAGVADHLDGEIDSPDIAGQPQPVRGCRNGLGIQPPLSGYLRSTTIILQG